MEGRVKPTFQTEDGISINDDRGLEREADVMGKRASEQPAHVIELKDSAIFSTQSVAQCKKRFGSVEEVSRFVKDHPPDKEKQVTFNKYLNDLKDKAGKPDKEDIGWLEQEARKSWDSLSVKTRKQLDLNQWKHIWRGDIGAKGHPTGFHWKGKKDEAICEAIDPVSSASNGFYRQKVRVKPDKIMNNRVDGKLVKNKEKPDGSTFFPDAWTEDQVKDAIELRDSNNEITTPKEAAGIKLHPSGDTIYPLI
jgi:hypothetical protein